MLPICSESVKAAKARSFPYFDHKQIEALLADIPQQVRLFLWHQHHQAFRNREMFLLASLSNEKMSPWCCIRSPHPVPATGRRRANAA